MTILFLRKLENQLRIYLVLLASYFWM